MQKLACIGRECVAVGGLARRRALGAPVRPRVCSVMLTSTALGLVTMALFKPRGWCVYRPMGTMTQGICKLKEDSPWKRAQSRSSSC